VVAWTAADKEPAMSELKSILLHVDAANNAGARLEMAERLARAHGARIEAVYAVLPAVLQYPFAFTGDGQGAALLMNYEAEQRERAKAGFESARQAGGGAVSANWQEVADEPVRALTDHAWAADLMLLAQPDPAPNRYSGVPPDFVTAVLLASGKPGLVMPFIGAGATLGDNVLIAWKPTPESARAVTAALPILLRARQVHMAVWDETSSGEAAPATLPVIAYLKNHGITARLHRGGRPTRELGDLLLSLAADLQADLLVMGCYGHGRAREWVLGGVTRTILGSMTVPTLMVH
jgi:nucleotide-binding universal stress UspA family protein